MKALDLPPTRAPNETDSAIHSAWQMLSLKNWGLLFITALVAVCGAGYMTARHADEALRADLLLQGRLVKEMIDLKSVAALSGTEQDLTNPEYQHLKDLFARTRRINPHCRFFYLMGRNQEGMTFFYVDSEPPDSEDYSPPGQVYNEADEAVYEVFETRQEKVLGPLTDRWGSWVCALIPLDALSPNAPPVVLGMDVAADEWKWTVRRQAAAPAALVSLAAVMALLACQLLLSIQGLRAREKQLRESLQTSADLASAIPSGLCIFKYVAPDRLILISGNEAAERLTGISLAEWVNHEFNEIWPHAREAGMTEKYLEVMRTGKTFELEGVKYTEKERSAYFWIRAFPLPGGRLAIAFEDLTDRQKAEQTLLEAHRRLADIIEFLPDATFVIDQDKKVITWNRGVEKLTGVSAEEILGKTSYSLCFYPELRPILIDIALEPSSITRVKYPTIEISGNEVYAESFVPKAYGGKGAYCWATASKLLDTEGNVVGAIESVRDITVRKHAQEEATEWKKRYDLLARSAGNIAYDYEVASGQRVWGGSLSNLLGYASEELTGGYEQWKLLIHPHDSERTVAILEQAKANRAVFHVEYLFQHKDGHFVLMQDTGYPLLDGQGQVERYIGVMVDITAHRKAEDEHKTLEAQLLQAQKMESVGRLAGGVAHDYNNMLVVILGHTEIALDQMDPSHPLHDDLLQIHQAAQRSADLTRQLLAFARKQTVSPKVLDLNEKVSGMLKMLQRLIGEDIRLVWRPGSGVWQVKIDPTQIDQILANLSVNARDAIVGVGNLTIETRNVVVDEAYCRENSGYEPGEYAMLAVSDDGVGMDHETLGKIFEPFFTTKEVGKGTGLGLATIYGIVRQNNGFINVYSELGHGTTFKIYIPRYTGDDIQTRKEGFTDKISGGQETLLLVEDEPAVLSMAKNMLERLGYRVLTTSSPEEAIHMAENFASRIQLLITDVVMPGMSGRDLAARLHSLHPNLKQLFMSGYTAESMTHHHILDEQEHFLSKPFSIKDLAQKVREVLES